MKLTVLGAVAAIGLGAMILPVCGQAATIGATVVTAGPSHAIQDVACRWVRVHIKRHRDAHGHIVPAHWVRRKVCK